MRWVGKNAMNISMKIIPNKNGVKLSTPLRVVWWSEAITDLRIWIDNIPSLIIPAMVLFFDKKTTKALTFHEQNFLKDYAILNLIS